MKHRKDNLMGAHESTHNSQAKTSPAGKGTRDKRTLVSGDRGNADNPDVLPSVVSNQNHHINNTSVETTRSSLGRSSHDVTFESSSHEDIGAHTDFITNRGRVAYMKAVKNVRAKGTHKHYKIPHDAIVNSMMKVESLLAGTAAIPVFAQQILLSAAKAESAHANSSKSMRRSMSEHVVSTTGSPPNNRIRDQMRKEKLINEQMRTNGDPYLKSRTQSFILPRTLHVIPEQPEDESNDPENYSYSDINVYF